MGSCGLLHLHFSFNLLSGAVFEAKHPVTFSPSPPHVTLIPLRPLRGLAESPIIRSEMNPGFERERERITDTRYGNGNQTKENELAWMGIEPMVFTLALRRSNH